MVDLILTQEYQHQTAKISEGEKQKAERKEIIK